jgi:hypothetical protein
VRGRPLPRLNAWFADAGLRYSIRVYAKSAVVETAEMTAIKQRIEDAASARFMLQRENTLPPVRASLIAPYRPL